MDRVTGGTKHVEIGRWKLPILPRQGEVAPKATEEEDRDAAGIGFG